MSRLVDSAKDRFTAKQDADGLWYVDGPCNGMQRNSGTLWPWSRLPSQEVAEATAKLCTSAYIQGVEDMRRELQLMIGVAG